MDWINSHIFYTYLIWEIIVWIMLRITKAVIPCEDEYKLSIDNFLFFWLFPVVNIVVPLTFFIVYVGDWFYKKTYLFWNWLKFIVFGE